MSSITRRGYRLDSLIGVPSLRVFTLITLGCVSCRSTVLKLLFEPFDLVRGCPVVLAESRCIDVQPAGPNGLVCSVQANRWQRLRRNPLPVEVERPSRPVVRSASLEVGGHP